MKSLLPLLIFIIVLVAAVILFIVFAGGGKYSDNPPRLTVVYDDVSQKAGVGTHSWHSNTGSYEACGDWIFAMTKPVFELSDERTVTLDFEAQPDKVSIKYWPAEYLNSDRDRYHEYEKNSIAITADGNTFTLPEGEGFIFEVRATWYEGTLRKAYGTVPFRFIIR